MALSVIEVLTAHLGVLGDTLLPGLSAHNGPPHCARHQAAESDQDGGGEDEVGAPG